MDVGRPIDTTFHIFTNACDWRCEFTHKGERRGCWVGYTALRTAVLTSALRHYNIFDMAGVTQVTIRQRKDFSQWTLNPKINQKPVW